MAVKTIARSAIVPYSDEQMFMLVDDVEQYPEFLPWCSRSSILSVDGDVLEAEVEIKKSGLTQSFVTRNTRTEFSAIHLSLVRGPFKSLEGSWQFAALDDHSCKVQLQLEYTMKQSLFQYVLGPLFEDIANTMVEKFCERAATVYGTKHRE